jgi:hypothetical protein
LYCSFFKRELERERDPFRRHLLRGTNQRGGGKKGRADAIKCNTTDERDSVYELAIFDLARCIDPNWYPWGFMENLKNGWFCSTKYDGGFVMVKPDIKIVVFTNTDPPKDKLSIDRYDVYKI